MGWGGFVCTSVRPAARAQAVAVDSVGRIVVGGQALSPAGDVDFVLVRYLPNGVPDPTFGTGGVVATRAPDTNDQLRDLVVDPLGRIVVCGYTSNGTNDLILARYTPDGSLDPSFAGGGRVVTDLGGLEVLNDLDVDAAGRIVAGGNIRYASNYRDFLVVRYLGNGDLDSSFGIGGSVVTSVGAADDVGAALVIDGAGRPVVGGSAADGPPAEYLALARYTTDGQLDPTFGSGGTVFSQVNGRIRSLTLDPAGRLLGAGYVGGLSSSMDLGVVRLTASGAFDTTFGPGGTVVTAMVPTTPANSQFEALTLDGAGRLVAAGYSRVFDEDQFLLARAHADTAAHVDPGPGIATYAEGADPVAIAPDLLVAGDGNTLSGGTVAIGNYVPTEDVLTLVDGFDGLTFSFDLATGNLSVTGTAGVNQYAQALRQVRYQNVSDHPDPRPRMVTFTVADGSPFRFAGAGARTLVVRPANDAPAVTDDAVVPAVLQGSADPAGRRVGALFGGLAADPDAGDALSGVAVVGNPQDGEQGAWEYTTDGTAWHPVGAVADGPEALALSAAARLRFRPAPWFNGTRPR